MPLLTILGIVVTVVLIMGALGAAIVIVRGSGIKESAAGWRDESDAQKARADRLSLQVDELTKQIESLTARLTVLEADNSRLSKMVTAQAEIQALSEKVSVQHSETMAAILAVGSLHGSTHA